MKRLIWHWTAGGHTPNGIDRQHYHYIIAGDGQIVTGLHPVEANLDPQPGKYAAHTLQCNTGSIGLSVAAMAGAVERPFSAGQSPITDAQVKALVSLTAQLCKRYGIPVTRQTVLSHAEVQPTLGIKQRGKWDIAWLPGMTAPGDPVAVGDKLRAMVAAELLPTLPPKVSDKPARGLGPKPAPGFWATVLAMLAQIFNRR